MRVAEAEGREVGDLYDERFLLERPLLRTVRAAEGAVLLIDEIDRSDSEFEAFLLEFLSDFQITIPEVGTLRAARPPVVVLTSNRTRELHDALKRRCLYHWIPFPDAAREREILRAQAPGLDDAAAAALVEAIKRVRNEKLLKRAGIAETIDWAQGARTLADEGVPWPAALRRSLGLLLKEQEDVERVQALELPVLERMPTALLARDHLHLFLRALEEAGVAVSSPKKADFLVALVASPPADVEALYWRARVTLRDGAPRTSRRSTPCSPRSSAAAVSRSRRRPARRRRRAARPPRRAGGDDADARRARAAARAPASTPARWTSSTCAASRATSPEARDELRELVGRAGRGAAADRRAPLGARPPRPALDVRRVLAAANRSGGEIVRLRLAAAAAAAAPRAAADRRVGLAARAQPRPAALRPRGRAGDRPRRGVHVRHAAHPRDGGARHARRRRGARRAVGVRARRRRRHADRRRAAAVPRQQPLRGARARRAR